MEIAILILAVIGLLLSLYANNVGRKLEVKNYRPLCDISGRVSCTRAFSSPYGKTFGVYNSVYGIIFYLIIVVLALLNEPQYIFILSLLAFIGTIYLVYALIKIRTFCVVCASIYVINILLLIVSYLRVF